MNKGTSTRTRGFGRWQLGLLAACMWHLSDAQDAALTYGRVAFARHSSQLSSWSEEIFTGCTHTAALFVLWGGLARAGSSATWPTTRRVLRHAMLTVFRAQATLAGARQCHAASAAT